MKSKSAAQKIIGTALSEKSIGEKKRANLSVDVMGITKSKFVCEPAYMYVVSIEDKPISRDRLLHFDSDIRFTKGHYTIQYVPASNKKRNPKFPYLIGQDLVRIRVTVSGPRHWGCLCNRIPELGWIERNSTFRDEMFAIAKKHPGLVLRFNIDYPKYCRVIEERAEREGIDIDHKPLFTYAWNDAVREEMNEIEFKDNIKTKADYIKELQEAEKSSTVLEEIRGN